MRGVRLRERSKMMELIRVVMIFGVFLGAMSSRLPRALDEETTDENDSFSLDQRNFEPNTCKAKNGENGICVHESYCNEEHTIMPGGVIDKSEFRESTSKPCPGQFIWCCTQERVIQPPVISSKNTDSCLAPDGDICPWAVSLYKVADLNHPEGRLFCMGALIGSRIILTAATCLKAAQHHMLYARVPVAPVPNRNYTVRHRKFHPEYNSGSHAYDFGILVLEEEVNWGKAKGRGACLAFNKLEGSCLTLGFDSNDEITSTMLKVTKDGCNNFGGKRTREQACGTKDDSACIVATGAPVLCESKKGGAVVVGVTRSGCNKDQVLLGSLEQSSTWITNELNAMKVSKDVYLQK